MQNVQKELQRLNKQAQIAAKFAASINWDQCLEHFCSKGRKSLHCQKVGKISGYG